MRFKHLIIICLSFSSSLLGQHYDFVKIIPGQGIVYNNDTILLYSTTIEDIYRIFKFKDPPDPLNPDKIKISLWSGENDNGGIEFLRLIEFKSIIFKFFTEGVGYLLELSNIYIKEDNSFKAYTDNGLMIGMINPNINEIFPSFGKKDYISESGLSYQLFSHGISLKLEKINDEDLKIIEIEVYRKIE